jgi:hypothetical protein
MTITAGDDVKPEKDSLTVGQVANVKIPFTGEAALKLDNSAGRQSLQDTFEQSLRVMVNAIESHTGVTIKNGASRAYGTAGTTPFASDHKAVNHVGQILRDNACPFDGRLAMVLNTTAGTNFRNLSNLYKVNESGDSSLLRQGTLGELGGFMIKESAGVASHTKGTGAGYLVDLVAGYAIGDTTVHVDTGTGTLVAGDVITVANDASSGKYVITTGFAGDGDGDIAIGRPGLTGAIANNAAVTIGDGYAANMAFHQSAVELVMRPPAIPGRDAAVERMTMFDAHSGLSFEVAVYLGYGMIMYDITCFYQAKVWKPEFVATLLG